MLRTWTYAWWRPVVGVLLLAIGMLIVVPLITLPSSWWVCSSKAARRTSSTPSSRPATLEKLTPAGMLYLNLTLGAMIAVDLGIDPGAAPDAAALAGLRRAEAALEVPVRAASASRWWR